MYLRILAVLGSACILYGCSTGGALTQEVYDEYLVKSFSASTSECYNATKSALDELGYEVGKESSSKGKIITKRKDVTEQESRYSLAGEHKDTYDVSTAYKYYFTVSEAGNGGCQVKVERFRFWYKGKEVVEMNIPYVNEHQWMPIFTEIEEKLNDEI